MLLTFSVNQSPYEEINKVAQLLTAPKTQRNCEWLSESYLKIIEGKARDIVNLSAYSRICETNAQLTRLKRPETSIITTEEIAKGYKGVTEIVADYVDDSLEDIIEGVDESHFINAFLDLRERIYYSDGKDLWRLVELSKLDDRKAQVRLREVIKEYDIKELIEYILVRPLCYKKLEGILC